MRKNEQPDWDLVSRCRICGMEFKTLDEIKAHVATHRKDMRKAWRLTLFMGQGDDNSRVPVLKLSPEFLPDHNVKGMVAKGPFPERGGLCPLPMSVWVDDLRKLHDAFVSLQAKFAEICGNVMDDAGRQYVDIASGLPEEEGRPRVWEIAKDDEVLTWMNLACLRRLDLPMKIYKGLSGTFLTPSKDLMPVVISPDSVQHEWLYDFGYGFSADLQAVTNGTHVFFRMIWFKEKDKPGEPCYDMETGRTDGRVEIHYEDRPSMDGLWKSKDGKHDIEVVLKEVTQE